MENEDILFRRLRRAPIKDVHALIQELWKIDKDERIELFKNTDELNKRLEHLGWTIDEYINELEGKDHA